MIRIRRMAVVIVVALLGTSCGVAQPEDSSVPSQDLDPLEESSPDVSRENFAGIDAVVAALNDEPCESSEEAEGDIEDPLLYLARLEWSAVVAAEILSMGPVNGALIEVDLQAAEQGSDTTQRVLMSPSTALNLVDALSVLRDDLTELFVGIENQERGVVVGSLVLIEGERFEFISQPCANIRWSNALQQTGDAQAALGLLLDGTFGQEQQNSTVPDQEVPVAQYVPGLTDDTHFREGTDGRTVLIETDLQVAANVTVCASSDGVLGECASLSDFVQPNGATLAAWVSLGGSLSIEVFANSVTAAGSGRTVASIDTSDAVTDTHFHVRIPAASWEPEASRDAELPVVTSCTRRGTINSGPFDRLCDQVELEAGIAEPDR